MHILFVLFLVALVLSITGPLIVMFRQMNIFGLVLIVGLAYLLFF